mgnify:CR=1 FL=1
MKVVCIGPNHILDSLTKNKTYLVVSYWSSVSGMSIKKPPYISADKLQYGIIDDSGITNYYDSIRFLTLDEVRENKLKELGI